MLIDHPKFSGLFFFFFRLCDYLSIFCHLILNIIFKKAVGEQVDSNVSYLCSFLPEKFMKQGVHCFRILGNSSILILARIIREEISHLKMFYFLTNILHAMKSFTKIF